MNQEQGQGIPMVSSDQLMQQQQQLQQPVFGYHQDAAHNPTTFPFMHSGMVPSAEFGLIEYPQMIGDYQMNQQFQGTPFQGNLQHQGNPQFAGNNQFYPIQYHQNNRTMHLNNNNSHYSQGKNQHGGQHRFQNQNQQQTGFYQSAGGFQNYPNQYNQQIQSQRIYQGGNKHNNMQNNMHYQNTNQHQRNDRQMQNQKYRHQDGPLIVDENEFEDTLCQACTKGKIDFIKLMEATLETFIDQSDQQTNVVPNLDQFERKILHKLCERYGLRRPQVHKLEENKGNITIEKTECTRMQLKNYYECMNNYLNSPQKKVIDLFNEYEASNSQNQQQQQVRTNRPVKILSKTGPIQNSGEETGVTEDLQQATAKLENMTLNEEQNLAYIQKKEQYINKKNDINNSNNYVSSSSNNNRLNSYQNQQNYPENPVNYEENINDSNVNNRNTFKEEGQANFGSQGMHIGQNVEGQQVPVYKNESNEYQWDQQRKDFNQKKRQPPHSNQNYNNGPGIPQNINLMDSQFPQQFINFLDPQFKNQMKQHQNNFQVTLQQLETSQAQAIPAIYQNKNNYKNRNNNYNNQGQQQQYTSHNQGSMNKNYQNNNYINKGQQNTMNYRQPKQNYNYNQYNPRGMTNNRNNQNNMGNYVQNTIQNEENVPQNNYEQTESPNIEQFGTKSTNSSQNIQNVYEQQQFQESPNQEKSQIKQWNLQQRVKHEFSQLQKELSRRSNYKNNSISEVQFTQIEKAREMANSLLKELEAQRSGLDEGDNLLEQLQTEKVKITDQINKYSSLIQDQNNEKDQAKRSAIFAGNDKYQKKIKELETLRTSISNYIQIIELKLNTSMIRPELVTLNTPDVQQQQHRQTGNRNQNYNNTNNRRNNQNYNNNPRNTQNRYNNHNRDYPNNNDGVNYQNNQSGNSQQRTSNPQQRDNEAPGKMSVKYEQNFPTLS